MIVSGSARKIQIEQKDSFQRFKHQSFVKDGEFYVFGGTTLPLTDINQVEPRQLKCVSLQATPAKWQSVNTKCTAKDFDYYSGQAAVMHDNKWYVYGGTNSQMKSINILWRLNLENWEWTKLEQKGEIPKARQSAYLFAINPHWLVVYGGVNTNDMEIYNTFHFYNLESAKWQRCDGCYKHIVFARYSPSLCYFKDKLYLFGGSYRNKEFQQKDLNDFYEFSFIAPGKNPSTSVTVRRLQSQTMPDARSGHNLLPLNSQYLVLLNGQNCDAKYRDISQSEEFVKLASSIWVYKITDNKWIQAQVESYNPRTMATAYVVQDKVYIFGGLINYLTVSSQLTQLTLQFEQKQQQQIGNCSMCRQTFFNFKFEYAIQYIQDLQCEIQFPYAAFGLLVDNAVSTGAEFVNIVLNEEYYNQSMAILRIEDNAKINWTDAEFYQIVSAFRSKLPAQSTTTDKRAKSILQRKNHRIQYGNNLKLGAMRLGQSFLYLSLSEDEGVLRVILFEKCTQIGESKYVLHYYSVNLEENRLADPAMAPAQKRVQERYSMLLGQVLKNRIACNVLFIFNPIIGSFHQASQGQYELYAYPHMNDVINGRVDTVFMLEGNGYNIFESVDTSLRAYLACLYLKNDQTRIGLSVREGQLSLISNHFILDKIDRLAKDKLILDLNNLVDYDFKIVELYYLYDLSSN